MKIGGLFLQAGMGNYIAIQFNNLKQEQSEILIAELSASGYEGFEEQENSLKAFVAENNFTETALNEIAVQYNLSFQKSIIQETNWNQLWESNFQPVVVDDFAGIRAEFHEPVENAEHEIIITPKMSFGTGHHATTYMMIQQMRTVDFKDKSVFDFGTGTGVLAILAEKLGAGKVLATDNDEWSISNATENIERNGCSKTELRLSSTVPAEAQFDIILANINKNIILEFLPALAGQLEKRGVILLSGLLKEDETGILAVVTNSGLKLFAQTERNNWLCIRLQS